MFSKLKDLNYFRDKKIKYLNLKTKFNNFSKFENKMFEIQIL